MTYKDIELEDRGEIVRLWHNRPQFRNAESCNLLEELDDAIRRTGEDPAVRVVILAGRGDHFSAGHDLKEAQVSRADFSVEQRWAYEETHYFEYCMRIWDLPKPTIAQVQGACIAGGFMMANMCDLIVASEDAFFSDPVTHSLGTASLEVLIHPWVMGMRKAKEMLFTGERIPALEAHRIGLVNRVVKRDELDQATLELAGRIAQAPPFGLKLAKRSLNRTLEMQGMRSALQAHFDTHELSHLSEEFQNARKVGLAKAISKGKAAE